MVWTIWHSWIKPFYFQINRLDYLIHTIHIATRIYCRKKINYEKKILVKRFFVTALFLWMFNSKLRMVYFEEILCFNIVSICVQKKLVLNKYFLAERLFNTALLALLHCLINSKCSKWRMALFWRDFKFPMLCVYVCFTELNVLLGWLLVIELTPVYLSKEHVFIS